MQRKTGVLIFTHGSRLKEGNDIMVKLVEDVRRRLGHEHIEACFMELGKPDMPTAIDKLVRQGCNHIFGYAFFLVPGKHLQKDIPAIFASTLKNHPGVTYEVTEPMMDDPAVLDLVEKRIGRALGAATPV